MDPNLADSITIILGILAGVQLIGYLVIWRYAKDMTWAALKANLIKKVYAIAIRWTNDHKWVFDVPDINPDDTHTWILRMGKKENPKNILSGSVGLGPDKIDMVVVTDDGISSVHMDEKGANEIWGTSGYVQKQIDLAYSDGYMAGFNDSKPTDFFSTIRDNIYPILVLSMIFIIGTVVLYDKVITSPNLQGQINQLEDEKNIIIAKCSPYIDLTATKQAATNQPPQTSNTGATVK